MQLLHIDSAITGEQSVSRQLTAQIVEAWKASHPATQVSYLDLVADAPAHFTMDAMAPRTDQTDGLSESDIDCSIRNLGRLGKEGMNETDDMILDIMTHKQM